LTSIPPSQVRRYDGGMSDKPSSETEPVHIQISRHGEMTVRTVSGEVLDSSELQAAMAAAIKKILERDPNA
jgi:hypothetical protein